MGSTPHTNIERNSSSGLQSMRATHDNPAILLHTSRLFSPNKSQRIKAYLNRSNRLWEGLYPHWFEAAPKKYQP